MIKPRTLPTSAVLNSEQGMETALKLVGVFTVLAALAIQFVLQAIAPQLITVVLWCGGWLIMGLGSVIRRLDERPGTAGAVSLQGDQT